MAKRYIGHMFVLVGIDKGILLSIYRIMEERE